MRPSRRLRLACLCLLLAGTTWAREPDVCPHPKGWKPTQEELQRILSLHNQWAEEHSGLLFRGILLEVGAPDPRRANLCNVDLRGFKLNNANLSGAQLNGADFFTAELNNAYLRMAELNGADLIGAKLNNADLVDAKLNGAVLRSAELNNANLGGALLNSADLYLVELNNARLNGAVLKRATLSRAYLTGALLAAVDLTGAEYAPASAGPPDAFVEGIMGLETVVFPRGQESGLMQLRDLLQKAGLRELEREATFAIEYGRTNRRLASEFRRRRGRYLSNDGVRLDYRVRPVPRSRAQNHLRGLAASDFGVLLADPPHFGTIIGRRHLSSLAERSHRDQRRQDISG